MGYQSHSTHPSKHHDGVRYVPEAGFLKLQERHNALKEIISGFLDQLVILHFE
jgi:hypothetical protein